MDPDKLIRHGKLKKQYLQTIVDFFETFEICFTATGLLVTQDPLTGEALIISREQIHDVLQADKRLRGFTCSRTSLTQHIDSVIDSCLQKARAAFPLYDLSHLRRIEI